MLGVGKAYPLMEGSIECLTTYLGALIREHHMPDKSIQNCLESKCGKIFKGGSPNC